MSEPFVHRLRVRYNECDPQGVVFNANYLAYFDIALTELWRAAFGGYAQMVERGVDLVVAEAQLRYRASARFDDELDLRITIERLGESSMASRHEILRGADVLVEGATRHVFVDAATLTKTAIPDWARSQLARWTAASDSVA